MTTTTMHTIGTGRAFFAKLITNRPNTMNIPDYISVDGRLTRENMHNSILARIDCMNAYFNAGIIGYTLYLKGQPVSTIPVV